MIRSLFHWMAGDARRGIHYVTDGANWSFYWDGHYITSGVRRLTDVPVEITRDPWSLRGQIVHFGDRYAFLSRGNRELHASNRVFLTWFHGSPDDPYPGIRETCGRLKRDAERLDGLVVPCEISKRALLSIGIPEEKITTIPLGVDLERFAAVEANERAQIRRELGIPENAFCIGSFQKDGAGWEEGREPKLIKGPDVIVDVVERLFSSRPELFVVITGPARGYVKERLDEIGVPYMHRFLDNYHDVVKFYQTLDLYLITSRAEGGPKALLESWACGVPVVSTRVGMPADLVENRRNGLLADVDDVATLAGYVDAMIEDRSLWNTCRQGGLRDVGEYGWDSVAKQYFLKLYAPFLPVGRA